VSVEVTGVTELLNVLEKAGPRHSRNLIRATIHGVAARITKQAKKGAPKDAGDLRKAIKTKRKKSPPTAPVSEVWVEHGKQAKSDAFYWRFVEYGTKNMSERPFIRPAADDVRADFERILAEEFGLKLEKALAREARRNAKK
jgi:HK97 gp10 family phage protein